MNWGGNSSVIFAMDSPSFGGLICSSTVVSGDMWRLGQLRPGDLVRLKPISFDSAQELSRRVDEHLDQLQAMTRGEEVAVQSLNLDLPILRVTDTNAILKTVESDQSLRPRVIYRQVSKTQKRFPSAWT
jgi:urea carboxylase